MRSWFGFFAGFLIFGPLGAMVAEPFFGSALDQIGMNTGAWAAPVVAAMFELFASEPFRYAAFTSIGMGIGIWLYWAAGKFDNRTKLKLTYYVRCIDSGTAKVWYLVLKNEGDDATFGAILDLRNLSGWRGAPAGSPHATWGVNENAEPWRKIINEEAAAMPIYKYSGQQIVYFYENKAFCLAMTDSDQSRREAFIHATIVCKEYPKWRKAIDIRVDDVGLDVTSSELQKLQ